jgi:G3E family GTPase
MVTVVDAANFLNDFQQADMLQDTGESLGEEDNRSVADLLVDQIEFCDVILISKTDLCSTEQVNAVIGVIKGLNPVAEIVPIQEGQVALDKVLATGKFDFERAEQSAGWLQEARGEHTPETEEYGISSFTYTARKPFNPQKFYDFLHQEWSCGKLIRSKGYFWLASRPQFAGTWSQAGGIARHGFAGMFWRAVPENRWPEDEESLKIIKENWVEPFGDMRQELVFIGQDMDETQVRSMLDECLISDQELLAGKALWETMLDPFPLWEQA